MSGVQAKLGGACDGPARTARLVIKTMSRAVGGKPSSPACSTRPIAGGVTGSTAGPAAVQNAQQMSLIIPEGGTEPAGGSAPPVPWQMTPNGSDPESEADCAVASPAANVCTTTSAIATAINGLRQWRNSARNPVRTGPPRALY